VKAESVEAEGLKINGVDVSAKLLELEQRIVDLEDQAAVLRDAAQMDNTEARLAAIERWRENVIKRT
jgi:hypothetical protein